MLWQCLDAALSLGYRAYFQKATELFPHWPELFADCQQGAYLIFLSAFLEHIHLI